MRTQQTTKNQKIGAHVLIPLSARESFERFISSIGGTIEQETDEEAPVPIDVDSIKPCDCLRGLRYRESLTQKEMSAKIGVTQGNLSAMERGKRPIGKALAKKIADIFGGSYKSFL